MLTPDVEAASEGKVGDVCGYELGEERDGADELPQDLYVSVRFRIIRVAVVFLYVLYGRRSSAKGRDLTALP